MHARIFWSKFLTIFFFNFSNDVTVRQKSVIIWLFIMDQCYLWRRSFCKEFSLILVPKALYRDSISRIWISKRGWSHDMTENEGEEDDELITWEDLVKCNSFLNNFSCFGKFTQNSFELYSVSSSPENRSRPWKSMVKIFFKQAKIRILWFF